MAPRNETGLDETLRMVIPERVKEAREARGFGTDEFGETIGVTRQAVAQYETGQNSPSAEVLGRILSATRLPPSFFTSERSYTPSLSAPFWRSLKRMEQSERSRIARRLGWAADVVQYIQRFLELPSISLPTVEWEAESGKLNEIENIALMLRDAWGLGHGPITDLTPILEYHGMILVRDEVKSEDMDALSRWQAGRPYILYSADVVSGPRTLFNLAHELGHVLLHAGVEVASENIAAIEREANRFAGAFLLPRTTFPAEVVSTSIKYFLFLKERWGVAAAAMVYRCKDLGILNDSQVQYLWRQMNSQGIRRKEPLDEQFQQSAPTVIRSSLDMLLEHNVQSKSDMLEELKLAPEDIEAIGALQPGWLSPDKVLAFKPKFKTA